MIGVISSCLDIGTWTFLMRFGQILDTPQGPRVLIDIWNARLLGQQRMWMEAIYLHEGLLRLSVACTYQRSGNKLVPELDYLA